MMLVLRHMEELEALHAPTCWALGFFDGVHLGHRRVISQAWLPGALRCVMTFDHHPLALLDPARQPFLLTPDAAYKRSLIEELGADVLLVAPFTETFARMSATDFLDALQASCRVLRLSVGGNWHFGRGGQGNATFLASEASRRGFEARIAPLLKSASGRVICSTAVREALSAGRLGEVGRMLGRPFCMAGEVEHGQHLARRLGFPTANIAVSPQAATPPWGVYEVFCLVQGRRLHGMANLGVRPSIAESCKRVRLEVHFPGWEGDLYGKRLVVQLGRFLRPEKKFLSIEELKEQIERDLNCFSTLSSEQGGDR